ncbi:cysteine--tRNA ligase [Bifidobacterium sp. IMAU50988]|uniref:Cysteine--tRNA ligase n=2 Tax=Bifidobacterium favimelis TaxID=3122979 RepID=A0ABU8ZP77_9BIFI
MSSEPHVSKGGVSRAAAGLHLYDTACHQVTPFRPIVPGQVGIYVCGATVQSSPHVGHIRTTLAFDVIRRWLTRLGYQVTLIRNVTDIDDKILAKSAAAGQRWWERAYIYEREFTQAYDALGALPPTYEPRATGHIPDMIDLIRRIVDRGHAYVVPDADGEPSGNVYFDVSSWPDYGELTHQGEGSRAADEQAAVADRMGPSVDAQASGADDPYNPSEDDQEPGKRDPRDFALWKASKPTDPMTARWQTPFGTGRPGWHLECSAMSHRYLGDDFDIHGGGLDLRFPHHENEMAQSRAAGWGFAHRWMHTAWVTQKGEKMSKSLGNGLSVKKVLEEHPAWVVRYALVSVQYRSMLEWSDQTLRESRAAYERICGFIDRAGQALGGQPSREQVTGLDADRLPPAFVDAMNDDINVSQALAAVFATIRRDNAALSGQEAEEGREDVDVKDDLLQVRAMLDVFGLDPLDPQWESGAAPSDERAAAALEGLVGSQLEARDQARRAKDFARADAIRDRLAQVGVTIEDTAEGSAWHLEG